jgi:hypothetical protein
MPRMMNQYLTLFARRSAPRGFALLAIAALCLCMIGTPRSARAQAQERPDGSLVYVVQAGDTVDGIAFAYGVTRAQIMSLNELSDPRLIQIGQTLIIRPPTDANAESNGEPAAPDPNALPELGNAGDAAPENSAPESPILSPLDDPAGVAPAPIIDSASGVLPALDPAAAAARVCLEWYDDANQNRARDAGEARLVGGRLTVFDALDAPIQTFEAAAGGDLMCIDALTPGAYRVEAVAPPDYALTTPAQLRLDARAGLDIQIAFGAVRGATAIPLPTVDLEMVVSDPDPAPVVRAEATTPADMVRESLGWVAFGLAGMVLIGGMGAALWLRRRG